MAEAAAVLTEVTGRAGEYRDQTVEEAWATRRPSGHPDWEIEGWVTSYLAIAAGELSTVTDVVPRLTGHPARTVAEHLRAHPEDWAHLPLDPGSGRHGPDGRPPGGEGDLVPHRQAVCLVEGHVGRVHRLQAGGQSGAAGRLQADLQHLSARGPGRGRPGSTPRTWR